MHGCSCLSPPFLWFLTTPYEISAHGIQARIFLIWFIFTFHDLNPTFSCAKPVWVPSSYSLIVFPVGMNWDLSKEPTGSIWGRQDWTKLWMAPAAVHHMQKHQSDLVLLSLYTLRVPAELWGDTMVHTILAGIWIIDWRHFQADYVFFFKLEKSKVSESIVVVSIVSITSPRLHVEQRSAHCESAKSSVTRLQEDVAPFLSFSLAFQRC